MFQACFLRGMNAAKCDHQEKSKYLDTWIQVSKHVDGKSRMGTQTFSLFFLLKFCFNCSEWNYLEFLYRYGK